MAPFQMAGGKGRKLGLKLEEGGPEQRSIGSCFLGHLFLGIGHSWQAVKRQMRFES